MRRSAGAYRLSGSLEPKVCGVHLRRGYRLAFTMQPPEEEGGLARVVVRYVGKRDRATAMGTCGRPA